MENVALRGCLIGCLGVVVLLAIVAGFLFYLAHEADLLTVSPRVDTLAHIGGNPVVVARLDPNQRGVFSVLLEAFQNEPFAPKLFTAFVPHEVTAAISLNRSGETSHQVIALSLRRLAGFFAWFGDDDNFLRFSPVQQNMRRAKEADGLFVVRSEWPTNPQTRALLGALPEDPLRLEGGHLFEAVADNRGMAAYVALEPFFTAAEQADRPGPGRHARTEKLFPESAPAMERLAGAFERVEILRLRANLDWEELEEVSESTDEPSEPLSIHEAPPIPAPAGDLRAAVVLEIATRSPRAAEDILFFLMMLRDEVYRALLEDGIVLESRLYVEGNTVHGQFEASGFTARLVEALREAEE
jgi:hypothetical protein